MTRHCIIEGAPNETGEVLDPIPHDDEFNPVYVPENPETPPPFTDEQAQEFSDSLGDLDPASLEEIEIEVPDPVLVDTPPMNEQVTDPTPAKPKYPNKLAEMFHETLFSRIRHGIFNGFRGTQRKRHRGTSSMTVGREIERLKKIGQTPKQGRALQAARGIGSLSVETDAMQLACQGKYKEALELIQTWEPHYARQLQKKSERIVRWTDLMQVAALTVPSEVA
jgi:hypothetical protein